jgi:superfamily II DNA/RNA helicase
MTRFDLRAIQIRLAVDFGRLRVRAGDVVEGEAEALLRSAHAPQHAVNAYMEHATGRKALLFTAGVKLAHEMAQAFSRAGISAEAIDAHTPLEQRRMILQRFHEGSISVLCNCGILTEGYDESSVDCIIMARPTRSRVLYTQCIGRATRLHPGKEDALILDLVGATDRHDLITAPVLFGLERKSRQLATKTLTEVLAEVDAEKKDEVPAPGPDGQLVSKRGNLFEHQVIKLRWLRVDHRHYSLPLAEGYLALESSADQAKWALLKVDKGIEVITRNLSLDWAQGRGNDLACSLGAGGLNNGHAKWRDVAASAGQISFMRQLGLEVTPKMTKGHAFDQISIATFRKQWQKAVAHARQRAGAA